MIKPLNWIQSLQMHSMNRGVARDELGDYLGAIKDYDKAIELDPNDSEFV